ncbi:alpha/beta hydrolase [Tahibacter amnicola]|uniref:Alpha/beta hydrolase n=1 Tax=Tahibacter amnicola TaxID=2976241 RepID=A0ABY6BEI3_9GAMM|nr:alpha/beta hydrolase [Tahibacter amnicola]UXI68154.1 alpha/beta hydrolase [Tahibacter amnicola]
MSLSRKVLALLALPLVAYVIYLAFLYAMQRSMLFPIATAERYPYRGTLTPNAELVEAPVSFGKMRGVFLRGPQEKAPVVIYCHGNGEIVDYHLTTFQFVQALGVHVFLLELPGYAGADGEPTLASIREVVVTAYDWLIKQPLVDPARVIAMGTSIGGAPAAELSHHRAVRALVVLSTFTSVADLAGGYYVPAWFVRDPFDTAQRLREFVGPVFIAHGRFDEMIPFAHGQMLARSARQSHFQAYDCGHNDCPYREPQFAAVLGEFLRTHGILGATTMAGTP